MELLSIQIEKLIETLVERVSSMEETAENCAVYTTFIGELFTLLNTVKRMEQPLEEDLDSSPVHSNTYIHERNNLYFKKVQHLVDQIREEVKVPEKPEILIDTSSEEDSTDTTEGKDSTGRKGRKKDKK